jgi:hypothetical protein
VILFCGIPSEPPLTLAIRAAEELGIEHVILNQRSSHFCDIQLAMEGNKARGLLWAWEREWPLENFTGVYTRLMECQDLPENRPRRTSPSFHDLVQKSFFLHETLNAWLELADCHVVNRTRPSTSNVSKPYQAQWIRKAGFRIPATLITNDPAAAKEFLRRHGRVIYKSISSVRSIVQELTPPKVAELDRIRCLPTQFQAHMSGVDVRVHVVGENTFATRVRTEAVDYRYAQRDGLDVEMKPFVLPEPVAARCRTLSQMMELPFCGIDLKLTPEGEYYCFEVNPSPAYSYYQESAGQPIAQALVSYLAGRKFEGTEAVFHASAGN